MEAASYPSKGVAGLFRILGGTVQESTKSTIRTIASVLSVVAQIIWLIVRH